MDAIPPGLVTSVGLPSAAIIGLFGLVALGVRWIMSGRLVPLRHYEKMEQQYLNALEDRDATIADLSTDRDKWRDIAHSATDQNAELLTNQDLTLAVLNSIKAAAHVKDGGEL